MQKQRFIIKRLSWNGFTNILYSLYTKVDNNDNYISHLCFYTFFSIPVIFLPESQKAPLKWRDDIKQLKLLSKFGLISCW